MRILKGISYDTYEIMCEALGGCAWAATVFEAAGDLLDVELDRFVEIKSKFDVVNFEYRRKLTALDSDEFSEIIIK